MSYLREFFNSFLATFIFLIILFANPAFAYTIQEANSPRILQLADYSLGTGIQNNSINTTNNASTINNINNSYSNKINTGQSCVVSRLSPIEAKSIMDLTHNGFNGKKVSETNEKIDDNSPNKNVKDIGKTSLIGESNDSNVAVKVSAPQYASTHDKFSYFDKKSFSGPFGVGFIIDSTLRVGRCQEQNPTNCKINWNGLEVKTSGVGFKSDLVNAFQSVVGTSQSIAQSTLSSTDYNKLKNNYMTDLNTKDFTVAAFGRGSPLVNSILTDSYTAKNATTCNNSACVISTYSAFDKYYNAWLTTDLVVFTIGPTLWYKADKLMSKFAKSTQASPSSGWQSFLPRLKEKFTGTPEYLMKKIGMPASKTLGQARMARFKSLVSEEGFEPILKNFYIGKKLFSTGGAGEIGDLLKPESPIWKFTPEKRRKFFEAIEHLRAYARENVQLLQMARSEYDAALAAASRITDPVVKSAAEKAALIEYGKKSSIHLDDWDELLALDFEDWWKTKEDLLSFGGTAVRMNGPIKSVEGQGFIDIPTSQPFNLKYIVQQYGKDGSWAGWANKASSDTFEVAADGVSLQLYKIKPEKVLPGAENIGIQDLKFHVARLGQGTYSIKTPDGKYLPLTPESISYIESLGTLPGSFTIFEGAYTKAGVLTPEDFATRITHKRVVGRPNTALRNTEEIYNSLIQQDYAQRKFFSILDEQFAKEGDMIKAYYKNPITGLYKGTLWPLGYWMGKQGFGNEDYSAFMLPDTWSTLTISQGVDKLYKDSFIDFFVNEGSDQGDLFKRALNSIPFVWNKAIEVAANTNTFTNNTLSKVSGGWFNPIGGGFLGTPVRDTVGDVAIYSHNENCADCGGTFTSSNTGAENYLGLSFKAGSDLRAFIIEAADDTTKQKSGTVLISYTHHSDLKGKTGQVDGEAINLANAPRDQATCDQRLRKWGLGFAGTGVGGLLGLAENMAYFAGFGPGLIASLIQQMTVARDLQDCVDDKEGYYVHFYVPPANEAKTTKSSSAISNENITSALSNLGERLNNTVKDKNTPVSEAMNKIKDQFDEFTNKAKQANILQATINMLPPNSGGLMGQDIFYIWFKENLMPIGYKTEGKSFTIDGNMSVEKDYAKGILKINGKQVIDSNHADHVRMIAQDNRVPAEIVPMTLNKISAPNTNELVFQMNTYGEIKVLNAQVLNCIQQAIYDQSGIQYSGDELTQAFGELDHISTQNYGTVFARDGRIYLEGSGPRMQGSNNSTFNIDGYWNSKLVLDANQIVDAGQFSGMAFKHGSIVLNPQTNEIIIWLRQYKDAVLSAKDVKGLEAQLTSIKDPVTGCDNTAINLNAIPFQNDELGAVKVNNFNTSMNKLGPFTQFTTPNYIYEFYANLDSNTGECKQYFRVIDRNSGKILTDQEIVGGVKQSPDGTISFRTADGKDHTLKFDAQNGVPTLSYNGGPSQPLLSAQGPNGSFWYDPNTGQWYPENGLQIPLNQAFKDNGAWFGTDKNGNVTGTPENKMTFNIGSQNQGGFNVPSLPETAIGMIAFVSLFLILTYITTQGRMNYPKKKKG